MNTKKDKKHRVLIVEDNASLVRALKDNYTARGYEVRVAMQGNEALDMALQWEPDLILLDIMLPQKNGYEVCEALRIAHCETPIIMLTAKGQEQDIIYGLNAGADDYVTKPFSIAELLARSQAFLRRYPKHQAQSFHFGDFKLDTEARKLFKQQGTQQQEIKLTPKEYRLLKLFCDKQGKALTRDTILNVVWSRSIINTSRSVDRCVNTLRKKIEPKPGQPVFIHAVRDIGYRFDCGT